MTKKLFISLIIILIIFNITVFQINGEPLINKSIRIGGDNHAPPYQYLNDNGIYKGFSVDIMNAVAIEMGLDIEFKPMPWYQLQSSIQKSEIDVILGMANSPYLESICQLSDPYINISNAIFVRYDNNHIVNLEDLSYVRVAVQKDNCPQEVLNHVDPESLIFVENQQQGILLLMMDKADVFVGDKLIGLYTIQKWKQTNFIKIVGEPIHEMGYSFAVKPEDQEYIELFDIGLNNIKKNGIYGKIYNKWFGELIKTPSEVRSELIKKVIIVLVFILGLFLIVLRMNQLLKIQVKKRTSDLAEANNQLLEYNEQIIKQDLFKKQILNSLFSSMITLENDGIISFYNINAKKLLNTVESKGVLGKSIYDTCLGKFIDFQHVRDVLENNISFCQHEKKVIINQVERIYSYYVNSLIDSHGELGGAIISIKDVTEEKRMQKSLLHKDKMSALGRVVAVMAHEIRNPLTAINTFTELLPEKIDNEKFRDRFLEYVPKELDRINYLVTDLLEYARPSMARKEKFILKYLVDEVIGLYKEEFNEKKIKIKIDIPCDIKVFCDRQQIKQVLVNLILNSIDAVNKNPCLSISATLNVSKCIIKVCDNGAGIPNKYIKKVMEPFFTLKKTGTGLGLSICYEYIKENDGEIYIESKENTGTCVSIMIPAEKGDIEFV